MIPTLRIMTRKSKMGFGKHKEYTIQQMIDFKHTRSLISSYFSLSSITYKDEILDELMITEEYRINKPSINKSMYRKFIKEKGYHLRKRPSRFNKPFRDGGSFFSKAYLQRINQGK